MIVYSYHDIVAHWFLINGSSVICYIMNRVLYILEDFFMD